MSSVQNITVSAEEYFLESSVCTLGIYGKSFSAELICSFSSLKMDFDCCTHLFCYF